MTGKQAFKRLRAAGWELHKRGGNHNLMILPTTGAVTVIPFGTLSPRAEHSVQRLVAGRPNNCDCQTKCVST